MIVEICSSVVIAPRGQFVTARRTKVNPVGVVDSNTADLNDTISRPGHHPETFVLVYILYIPETLSI